jgi:hypothetical protein
MTKNEMLYKIGLASGALHSILADLSCLNGGALKKALKARRYVMEVKKLVEQKVSDEALGHVEKEWQNIAIRELAKEWAKRGYDVKEMMNAMGAAKQ